MNTVIVGRLDNNTKVEVEDGTTIKEALSEGGFSVADNEVIQDIEGSEYSGNEGAVSGKGYFLVQRVKSGC